MKSECPFPILDLMNFHSYFRLVLEKQEKFDGHQQFFAIVQLIGTRKQAENFAYRYVVIFMVTKLRIFQCKIFEVYNVKNYLSI